MSVDDETWGEIRRCYCESDETITNIAKRLGVSRWSIYNRAKRFGWPARRLRRVRMHRESEKEQARLAEASRAAAIEAVGDDEVVGREEVVDRLYRAIVRKLARLEARMKHGTESSPADSERETRELSTMVRSFEKVTGVAAEIDRQRKPKTGGGASSAADAERMGREIAERLEALNAQWDSEQGTAESK